jgi:hypothetical protein
MGSNWFQRHLNWTYAIAFILSYLVILAFFILRPLDSPLFTVLIGAAIFFAINMVVGGWVLKKKGQSLWFLVLAIPVNLAFLLIVLLINNKRAAQTNPSTGSPEMS